MNETWKTIPFEDNYEVSDTGKVRNSLTKHIKSLRFDRYGYLRVTLYPSGKTYTIHRLVSLVFIDNPDNLDQVNHKNGDKTDNTVENLEWCDISYNSKHRDTVLFSKWKGSMNPRSKLTESIVREIRNTDFNNLSNTDIGKLYGVSREVIRRIRTNKSWKHII